MQTILTKWYGPTNTRGSRVRAWTPDESPEHRESITLSWDDSLDVADNHNAAMQALCAKHDKAFAEWLAKQEWNNGADRLEADGWANDEFMRGATNEGYAYVRIPPFRTCIDTTSWSKRMQVLAALISAGVAESGGNNW